MDIRASRKRLVRETDGFYSIDEKKGRQRGSRKEAVRLLPKPLAALTAHLQALGREARPFLTANLEKIPEIFAGRIKATFSL